MIAEPRMEPGTGVLAPINTDGYSTTDALNSLYGATNTDPFGALYQTGSGGNTGILGIVDNNGSTSTTGGTDTTGGTSQPAFNLSGQYDTAWGTVNPALSDANTGIQGAIRNYGTDMTIGQQNLDAQNQDAYLAQLYGTSGVNNMVKQGLQSGGVMLANKNAGDSSASEALARAYGMIGARGISDVNNQFAQSQNDLALQQGQFNLQKEDSFKDIQDTINNVDNSVINQLAPQIQQLNLAAENAGVADRIDIEAEKQRIIDLAKAQVVDPGMGLLNQRNQGIVAMTGDDARAKAMQLKNAGQSANNPYAYTSSVPMQFQGSGPFNSSMPLFQYGATNKNKQE